jgi:hypothetical protein
MILHLHKGTTEEQAQTLAERNEKHHQSFDREKYVLVTSSKVKEVPEIAKSHWWQSLL